MKAQRPKARSPEQHFPHNRTPIKLKVNWILNAQPIKTTASEIPTNDWKIPSTIYFSSIQSPENN